MANELRATAEWLLQPVFAAAARERGVALHCTALQRTNPRRNAYHSLDNLSHNTYLRYAIV